jgi:DNA replication protein DnaC
MVTAWDEQLKDSKMHKVPFDERLGLLVDVAWIAMENKRMERRLKEAKLRLSNACIEDIEYSARRQLDRAVIRQLATCGWVQKHQNVVLTGATGTGKTYIACALAQQACRKGHRAMYRRASRLFDELHLARADGTYVRRLNKLAKMDVLVIDDWGVGTRVREQDHHDLLEVLEDRNGNRSTIMTSQLPPNKWHETLNDPTVADAMCDRVLHNAHKIALKGPSRRKEAGSKKK